MQTKEALESVDEDIDENLKKMAFYIMKPDPTKFLEAGSTLRPDQELTIEERITMVKAEKILEDYKRSYLKTELEYKSEGAERLAEELEACKEKLYVDFGENVADIFIAFKHYGLQAEITEEDRKKYAVHSARSPSKK